MASNASMIFQLPSSLVINAASSLSTSLTRSWRRGIYYIQVIFSRTCRGGRGGEREEEEEEVSHVT